MISLPTLLSFPLSTYCWNIYLIIIIIIIISYLLPFILSIVDLVVDCSGSYGNSRWIGGGGIPAINERILKNTGVIEYIIPNVLEDSEAQQKYANKVISLPSSVYL